MKYMRKKIAVVSLQSVSLKNREQNIKLITLNIGSKPRTYEKKNFSNAETFAENIVKLVESCSPPQKGRKYFEAR